MAWDEWEKIKADVTDRQSATMQLNHVPVESGVSAGTVSGGLRSSKKAWLTAGEGVGSLRKGLGAALTDLEDGQAGLGAVTGCLSAAAQKDVYDSWKKYAEDVSERCGSLQRLLGQAGSDQLKTDEAVKEEIDGLARKYADTDAADGRSKGR
ncbi:hypothetical protein [Streptomyces sp. NPDC014685]|uniref:hypothetical protein n=1 Tax=Streptomyces sp. NPDC014685 TaxID=3364881 RepID=UPI0037003CEE